MDSLPLLNAKFRQTSRLPKAPNFAKHIKGCSNGDLVQWLLDEHYSRQRFAVPENNMNVGYHLHEAVLSDLQDKLDCDPYNASLNRQQDIALALLCAHEIFKEDYNGRCPHFLQNLPKSKGKHSNQSRDPW